MFICLIVWMYLCQAKILSLVFYMDVTFKGREAREYCCIFVVHPGFVLHRKLDRKRFAFTYRLTFSWISFINFPESLTYAEPLCFKLVWSFYWQNEIWFQRPAHAKIYYHCYRRSYPSVWIVLTVLCASINVASFRFFWSGEKTGFSPLLNCLNILRSVFSPFVGFVWVCKKQSFTILDSWLIRGSLALFVGCTPCTTLRKKALALTLPRHGTYLIECLVVLICCNVKSNLWGFDVYTSTSV